MMAARKEGGISPSTAIRDERSGALARHEAWAYGLAPISAKAGLP